MKALPSKYCKFLQNPRAITRARKKYENAAFITCVLIGIIICSGIIDASTIFFGESGRSYPETGLGCLPLLILAVFFDSKAKHLHLAEYFHAEMKTIANKTIETDLK
jgi:hypothetical protein